MSSAFKCDICERFYEYEPVTTLQKRGEWAVKDNGSVTIFHTDLSDSELELCHECSEAVASVIFNMHKDKKRLL